MIEDVATRSPETSTETQIAALLAEWNGGDEAALDELVPLVVDELRAIARRHLAGERAGHTLQPTAVVNELYLRLSRRRAIRARDRRDFLGQAAVMIRRLLVDHARRKRALKRGGPDPPRQGEGLGVQPPSDGVVALHQALDRLAELDPEQARVVELRHFLGLTVEEAAEALDRSPRTVARLWLSARAWLFQELSAGDDT